MKRKIVAALAASVMILGAVSTTGCIGRMATSGKVMKFNLDVASGKWARELVFLCLYIIPVYPIAGLIDLLIINSIEFHTGKNPISGQERLAFNGQDNRVEGPDGSVATSNMREDGSIDIEVLTATGERHHVNVVPNGNHLVARDASLQPIATVDDDGQVVPLGQGI